MIKTCICICNLWMSQWHMSTFIFYCLSPKDYNQDHNLWNIVWNFLLQFLRIIQEKMGLKRFFEILFWPFLMVMNDVLNVLFYPSWDFSFSDFETFLPPSLKSLLKYSTCQSNNEPVSWNCKTNSFKKHWNCVKLIRTDLDLGKEALHCTFGICEATSQPTKQWR